MNRIYSELSSHELNAILCLKITVTLLGSLEQNKVIKSLATEMLEWLRNLLSPLLIFAMCKYCKHNVWRQTLFISSKPRDRECNRTPPRRVGWEPRQPVDVSRANPPAAERSCQPLVASLSSALYWKKYIRGQYPVVLTVSVFVIGVL